MESVSGSPKDSRLAYIDIKFLPRGFRASLDKILRPLLNAMKSRVSDDVGIGIAICDDAPSLAVLGFIRRGTFLGQLIYLQDLSRELKTLSWVCIRDEVGFAELTSYLRPNWENRS
jgi:hypothetical protein